MKRRVPRHKTKAAGAQRVLSVDAENRSPLYHQIFQILRSRIYDGEYPEGSFLPSEHELAQQYRVSRITSVRALNELAASGLVVRSRGRGTRVNFAGSGTVIRGPHNERTSQVGMSSVVNGRVENFLDNLRQRYEAYNSAKVYSFDYRQAPADVAKALELSRNAIVQCAVRVWSSEKLPFGHLTTYVPAEIGRAWKGNEIEKKSLLQLLERTGITIGRVDERVTATLADMTLADRLSVSVGSPLLKLARTMYDQQARPVGYLLGLYPPDRYQYSVSLTRDRRAQDGSRKRPS